MGSQQISAVCWLIAAMVFLPFTAIDGGAQALTEVGGGAPAPAADPNPPIKRYNPKSTLTFTDQDAFLAAAWCVTVPMESFEDLTATNQSNQESIVVPGFTVTTDNPPRLGIWDGRFQDASASDGIQWLGVNENLLVVPQITTFTFDSPINHFGINLSDYGDFGGSDLVYSDNAGTVATAAYSGRPNGNRQFFGIITRHTQFTTVTLIHFIAGEFYGIDEISYCLADTPPYSQMRRPTGLRIPD